MTALVVLTCSGCHAYQRHRAWYLLEHPAAMVESRYFVPLIAVVGATVIAGVVALVLLGRKRS